MAETLLDALVKLNFEGEGAVGQAADAVRQIEGELKRIGALPNVNFNLGGDLPKTIDSLSEVSHAFRQLIAQGEQAEAALRMDPKNSGAAETVARLTNALRQQVDAIHQVQLANTQANEAQISQSKAVEARLERQRKLREEAARTTRPVPDVLLGGGAAGGGGTPPPPAPPVPNGGPLWPGGKTNAEMYLESVRRIVPNDYDERARVQRRVDEAREKEASTRTALNQMTPSNTPEFKKAQSDFGRAFSELQAAEKALTQVMVSEAKAAMQVEENERRLAEALATRTSQAYASLSNPEKAQFLAGVGIDPTADAKTQRLQYDRLKNENDLALNAAATDSATTPEQVASLRVQRARLEVAATAITEKEIAAQQAAEQAERDIAEARRVRRTNEYSMLGMEREQFLRSEGINPDASLRTQRAQMDARIAEMKLEEVQLEREGVASEEQRVRLTQRRMQLERQLAEAKERELTAARAEAYPENARRNAAADARLDRLTMSADDYAKARGIDNGEPLTRQRIQLMQQENALKQEAIAAEARRIKAMEQDGATEERVAKLDEQKAALVRQELQLRQQAAVLAARERKAAGGTGGFLGGLFGKNEDDDGFGQGFAYSGGMTLRYYAMYAGFAALQGALGDVFQMTEQYTLAVHDLSVALGTSYEEAAKAGQEYTKLGAAFGAGPVESIEAATKGSRTFRLQDGSADPNAGAAFTRVAGIIGTIEPQDRYANTQQDLIAVAKAFKVSADGLEGLYDKLLYVSHQYGYATPGEVMSGVAAVSDIGKESGYSPEQLAAAIASIQQGTGTTSDAAAGDLKRFLGAQNDPALVNLFARYNIDQDGSLKEKMDQLRTAFEGVDPEQRTRDLTALGGPRIASAINALFAGIPEANRAAAGAQTAGGSSAEQAREILDTLGGQMRKLGGELGGLFAAIANSGAGAVIGGMIDLFTRSISTIRLMVEAWGQVPAVIKDVIAAIVLLMAAGKAQAVLSGASGAVGGAAAGAAGGAAGGLLSRLLGRGAAGAVGGGLASFGAGGAAMTGLQTFAAGAMGSLTSLGTTIKTLGMGALNLAKALGPVALAIGTILTIVDAHNSAEGQAEAGNNMVTHAATVKQKLIEGDITGAQNAIANLQQDKKDASASASTFGGVLIDTFTQADEARADAYKAVDGVIADGQKQIDALLDAQKEAERKLPHSDWFGSNYNNISNGVALIQAKGVGADEATKILGDLLLQRAQTVATALSKVSGQQGAADLQDYILQRIQATNSPLTQESQLGDVANVLRAAKDNVAATHDSGAIESLRQLQEQVDRAWAASVVETTKAKIEVAQGTYTGQASQNAIRDILTQGLDKATQAGSVKDIVQLLNLADKQFIDAYKARVDAQKAILTSTQNALNAALGTIGDSFQGIGGDADTGNKHQDIRNDMKDAAARRMVSLFTQNFNTPADALEEALKLAVPSGSATQKPGADLAIAKALEGAETGNGEEQAKAAVTAAQLKVDNLIANGKKDTAEYYDAMKALNDSKKSYADYELNLAIATAAADPSLTGNPMAQAAAELDALRERLKATKDPVEAQNLQKQINDRQRSMAEMQMGINEAKANANVPINDPTAAALAAIEQAKKRMAFYKGRDDAKYWQEVKNLNQAKYDLAKAQMDAANNAFLLGTDMTDPVKMAQARVKQAQAQLAFDRRRGAGQDVLLADEVALKQSQNDYQGQKWQQGFNDMRTNYDLNRISLSTYMKYLQSQHDYLTAIKVKTRQQVDQLNEVDQALKALTDSMQGQWNLGDIKVPTAYEMRRTLAGGQNATSVSYVTITMTGSSTAEMQAALQGALGQNILQTSGTSPAKV